MDNDELFARLRRIVMGKPNVINTVPAKAYAEGFLDALLDLGVIDDVELSEVMVDLFGPDSK